MRIIWPMGAELPKPHKLEGLWDSPDYIAEVKLMGERMILQFGVTDAGEPVISLSTRSASNFHPDTPIDITHRWPQLQRLKGLLPEGTILDGEGFSPIRREEEIAGLFNYRSDKPMPDDMKLVVFDCLQYGATNIEQQTWEYRRHLMEEAVNILNSPLVEFAAYTLDNKRAFFDMILASGGEGVVLKHTKGQYFQGKKPANIWVKAKKKDTFDCVILGYKEAKPGKYSGLIGSVDLGQYKRSELPVGGLYEYTLVKVCNSSGITDDVRRELSANREAYLGRVVVVDAYERVPNSVTLKQPRIKSIRPEGSKSPTECVIEEL